MNGKNKNKIMKKQICENKGVGEGRKDGFRKIRILVVDDDAMAIHLHVSTIKAVFPKDTAISAATSSLIAKEILKETKVDLLISDYNMPVENGACLAEYVSQKYPDIKILMATSEPSAAVKELEQRGIARFVLKVINKDCMFEELKEVFLKLRDGFEQA